MRSLKTIIVLLLLLAYPVNLFSAESKWEKIIKGLDYKKIEIADGRIHAFRIDPQLYRFEVIVAKGLGNRSATVKDMVRKKKAFLAINGGFFTPEYDSLGLIINNGKEINPIKNTSWWSVFYLADGKPQIVHSSEFKKEPSVSTAIQSGPRLLINGSIPRLKPSLAERSAVCIDANGEVVLIATENLFLSTAEFSQYLGKGDSQGGVGCVDALNLDGGSSTQMYAHVNSFELGVSGLNEVANALAVYPK